MDIIKSIDEFKKYAQNYNMELDGIKKKYEHSFRVMNISTEIAKSLNLNDEQIKLATLIGLLHDIARFEEYTRFDKFSLKNRFDHGDYAIKILKENNFIRKFIEENSYDEIIFTAIQNHNKFMIEEGLDDEKILFCKIIRDADKVDIFYEGSEFFWRSEEEIKTIENSSILDSYFESFISQKPIFRVEKQSILDELVACMGFVFDINYKYSFSVLKDKDYINKILTRFNFKNEDTIKKIDEIRNVANKFIIENS